MYYLSCQFKKDSSKGKMVQLFSEARTITGIRQTEGKIFEHRLFSNIAKFKLKPTFQFLTYLL